MLVLTRKLGERIRIGDSIVLTIVQCKLGVVKLGIEAPREVTILAPNSNPGEMPRIPTRQPGAIWPGKRRKP